MIRLTNDPRFQVRRRAIAELARRGERVIPALQQTMQTSEVRLRRAAVWALSRIAQGASRGSASTAGKRAEVRRDALDALQLALSDRAPTIRQAAGHCLAMHRDDAALSALRAMVRDPVPAVRRVAGQALGRIGDPAAVPDLLTALGGAVDRAERHALTYALIEIDDAKATAQAFQDFAPQQGADQAATLEGALNALDQMDHGSLDGSLVISLLDAEDPGLRRAALRILQTHPEWYPLAVAKLEALLASPIPAREAGEWVAALLATLLEQPSVQQRVGSLLAESDGAEDPRRRLILESIGRHRLGTLPPSWEEPLAEMLQSEDPRLLEATLAAVGAIATDRFDDVLRQLGDNQQLPRTLRVSAYEAISGRGNRLETPLFTLLLAMLGTEGTPAEASRASRTLAAASLDAAQLQRLLPHLPQAGPMQLANLMTPFARTQDAATAEAFLEVVDGARGLAGVTPSVFSDTIKRFPASALPRANRLLARLQADREAKIARLDALLPLVRQGDPLRGKTLFFSDRAKCSSCHRVGEQGGRIGPDLTTIGANRATLDLLESTVFPSASLVRDYEPCQVLTLDGRLLAGIIIEQTATSLTLQQQTGEPLKFPRGEIEAIETSTVSLMPSGLEEALSEQELADVIAYLSRLR
jgi:putative heme-binding domain-containing protein